jgi:hypothetical protein
VRACKTALEPHADLAQSTDASVEDLGDPGSLELRADQSHWWVAARGWRWDVRRHEARVRAVILDGAVPPRMNAPDNFGQLASRALEGFSTNVRRPTPARLHFRRFAPKPGPFSIGFARGP